VNIISLLDFKTYFFHCNINFSIEHNSSIFRGTNIMIQQYRYVMRFVYVLTFSHTYKDIIFAQQAAGN
jgi:acetyltransferase-like isoleucine patch superfamily enzyme